MPNYEIRELIKKKRLKHYEVADRMGVSEYTLSKWLRRELQDDKKQEILQVIQEMEI